MKTIEVKLNATGLPSLPLGRINTRKLDGFTEADLCNHASQDEAKTLFKIFNRAPEMALGALR